ncbi:MAG: Spy/CpxP family protein refolding chaperone [Kiloniellaceae bacterium]
MMRAKLPWILLAVSLALNVFFIAGVAYTKYTKGQLSETPERRIDFVAQRLALTEEQRQGLLALRERASKRRHEIRGPRNRLRAALLAELDKPAFDRDRVLVLLAEGSERRRAHFADLAAELHAYLATLSPRQREAFLAMARERGFLYGLLRGPRRPAEAR